MTQAASVLTPTISSGRPCRRVLSAALVAYAFLVSFLAYRQSGYINADFVGYAAIARRILEHQAAWITGCWSPLISWLMIPLMGTGVNDLIAGRLVLILGGAVYLLGAYGIATRFHTPDARRNLLLTTGLMACAVLQAAEWATSMLNPDLLAAGVLFVCLYMLLDPALPRSPKRALLTGLLAGLAFLAKAYMLPFLFVLIPLTLLLRRIFTPSQVRIGDYVKSWIFAMAGLALVAGPWIGVLSNHYGQFTFSTAGSSNHANVSPGNFGNDPMWHNGLHADFIGDPFFGPDWSAFQDFSHFLHQGRVFFYNARNGAGHIAPWIILLAVAAAFIVWSRRAYPERRMSGGERFGTCWALLAAAIYFSGYCMVDVQARYIASVVSPLLCVAALLMILASPVDARSFAEGFLRRVWYASVPAALILVAVFSSQDIFRMERIAVQHPQSVMLARFRGIAEQMAAAGIPPGAMAANDYHLGLFVAYAADRLPAYLGAPLSPNSEELLMEQLQACGIRVFLRWGDNDPLTLESPWVRACTVTDALRGAKVGVYVLKDPVPPAVSAR